MTILESLRSFRVLKLHFSEIKFDNCTLYRKFYPGKWLLKLKCDQIQIQFWVAETFSVVKTFLQLRTSTTCTCGDEMELGFDPGLINPDTERDNHSTNSSTNFKTFSPFHIMAQNNSFHHSPKQESPLTSCPPSPPSHSTPSLSNAAD